MKKPLITLMALYFSHLLAFSEVFTLRVPDDGIQPHAAIDDTGTVHLIYFKGDPLNGNIFYCRKGAGADRFSVPVPVNSQRDSVIVKGTIRGPQMALGKNGRVHVSWMGGPNATRAKIGEAEETPMLYTRLNDEGTAFEPQRNLLTWTGGLDGGGTVAADGKGHVYVAWHGAPPGNKDGEDGRAVYLSTSSDEGKSFAREKKISRNGACGCCGMKIFSDRNEHLWVLYRSANEKVNRPETVMVSSDKGSSFEIVKEDPWNINACPMSTVSVASLPGTTIAAWETEKKVTWTRLNGQNASSGTLWHTKSEKPQKHPVLAINSKGEVLCAWTEGTGWERGGEVAWQTFNPEGVALTPVSRRTGLPVWSMAAAWAEPNGNFVVIY